MSAVDGPALTWPTRNSEWAVRDVLAHVLAADADLLSLLEAAVHSGSRPLHLALEDDEKEMARWTNATPRMFAQQLRERGDRWRALLEALPDSAFAIPARVWWRADPRALGDVIGDWRGHDSQHAEDVRLALGERRGDRTGEPRARQRRRCEG